jgi:hypothetical protein
MSIQGIERSTLLIVEFSTFVDRPFLKTSIIISRFLEKVWPQPKKIDEKLNFGGSWIPLLTLFSADLSH